MQIGTRAPLLEELLDRFRQPLGADFTAYQNHCYRVLNFCAALAGCSSSGRAAR